MCYAAVRTTCRRGHRESNRHATLHAEASELCHSAIPEHGTIPDQNSSGTPEKLWPSTALPAAGRLFQVTQQTHGSITLPWPTSQPAGYAVQKHLPQPFMFNDTCTSSSIAWQQQRFPVQCMRQHCLVLPSILPASLRLLHAAAWTPVENTSTSPCAATLAGSSARSHSCRVHPQTHATIRAAGEEVSTGRPAVLSEGQGGFQRRAVLPTVPMTSRFLFSAAMWAVMHPDQHTVRLAK
jgi:hypothetical protein